MPAHSSLRPHQLRAIILIVCLVMPIATGCQVLGIPSYRSDCVGGQIDSCQSSCPPTVLPPLPIMPAWLSRFHRESQEEPPPYPRFHPLPTRPMFSPGPPNSSSGANYLPFNSNPELGSMQGSGMLQNSASSSYGGF